MIFAQLFNWMLFGMLGIQSYLYYVAFPEDPLKRKCLVAFMVMIEAAQLGIATYDAFRIFGKGWGNFYELDKIGLQGLSLPILAGITSCLCQLFYATRIYAISGNHWISGIISILAAVDVAFGTYEGIQCFVIGYLTRIRHSNVFWAAILWAGSNALCHIIITWSMFYYLLQAKKRIAMKQTGSLLTRLIRLTLETGFLCAAINLLALVLFVASQKTLLYLVPLTITSKLYSNCLLALLNSRFKIVGGREEVEGQEHVSSFNIVRGSELLRKARNGPYSMNQDGGIIVEIDHFTDISPCHTRGG
ncbi:hypothetical protein BXZ70DRAFT_500389 [Cristinia sonorae]|uniref:DUF6534 domain-containing protein n=1 Tax=Cristinia sonorae TaxID=1940300 RepID=A0A8K0UIN7_9AGAR|nr:hypothetical protein BXZ70DRAFT_500389 [Cristinia sonorae]